MYIYRALLKHGYSNFRLVILEYCDSSILLERENYYIKLLNPEYNILQIAGSSAGRKLSPQEKDKMSASQPSSKKLEVLDLLTKTTTVYHSIHAAARDLNVLRRRTA